MEEKMKTSLKLYLVVAYGYDMDTKKPRTFATEVTYCNDEDEAKTLMRQYHPGLGRQAEVNIDCWELKKCRFNSLPDPAAEPIIPPWSRAGGIPIITETKPAPVKVRKRRTPR